MKIKIIQIGKTKDDYVAEGIEEFLKRLRPFAKIEIITLRETVAGKTFTREHCKGKEGTEILKTIGSMSKSEKPYVIALDEKGKEFTSMEFSRLLGKFTDSGQLLVYVIGGPYGLADEVKQSADNILAMSKMTFTHQMIRLFLLEQIYRGVSILKGKEYHNE